MTGLALEETSPGHLPAFSELIEIHDCLRTELDSLHQLSDNLSSDVKTSQQQKKQGEQEVKEIENKIVEFIQRLDCFVIVFHSHSKAEDDVLFPALMKKFSKDEFKQQEIKNKIQIIEEELSQEHHRQEVFLKQIFQKLKPFRRNNQSEDDMKNGMEDVIQTTQIPTGKEHEGQEGVENESEDSLECLLDLGPLMFSLRSKIFLHFRKEEDKLLPLLSDHFTTEELRVLLGKILGERSCEVLLDWLQLVWKSTGITQLEKNRVLSQIKEATKGTKFNDWLQFVSDALVTGAKASRIDNRAISVLFPSLEPDAEEESLEEEEATPVADMEVEETEDTASQIEPEGGSQERNGCSHYQRNCKILAPCCSKWFGCRHCHNEYYENHVLDSSITDQCPLKHLDRYKIAKMSCLKCNTVQDIGEKCVNESCGLLMASYVCLICNFFDDDKQKEIYHCPFCNVCRVGSSLGKDFMHCMKCNCCVTINRKEHKCLSDVLHNNCPVCFENLFESTKVSSQLKCGHYLHSQCLFSLSKTDFRCPTCRKQMFDMSPSWKQFDEMQEKFVSEHDSENLIYDEQMISCNECGNRKLSKRLSPRNETLPLVFPYKCMVCSSYNTQLV